MKIMQWKRIITISIPSAVALLYSVLAIVISGQGSDKVLAPFASVDIRERFPYDAVQVLLIFPFAASYYWNRQVRDREKRALAKPLVRWAVGLLVLAVFLAVAFRPSGERAYAALYYLLIVACGEEYVFRGFLYKTLRDNLPFGKAVIISGLVFGLAHGLFQFAVLQQPWTVVASYLGGGIVGALLFAWLLEWTGAIAVPISIHWFLDFCGYLV